MRNLDGWMREQMTGRMDGKDDHQGYYISSSSEGAQGKGKEGMKLSL
jgi:hypothetical protein